MINEDKKSRGQEGKQISSLHTLAPCGRGQGEGLYGLPRPHFVRPRNDETTCHSGLVPESHDAKILKQVQDDMSIEGKRTRRQANYVNSLTSCLPDIWTSKKKVAFTLAEVLITLGITGVVAAMTLPALIGNYNRHVAETRLKRLILHTHKLGRECRVI